MSPKLSVTTKQVAKGETLWNRIITTFKKRSRAPKHSKQRNKNAWKAMFHDRLASILRTSRRVDATRRK